MAQLKDLIVSGATRILGKTYSPEFVGKLTGNADTATKATGDSSGSNIRTTYAARDGFRFLQDGNGVYLRAKNGAGQESGNFAIPAASASAWGVVTKAAQVFAGEKTFNDTVHLKADVYSDALSSGALNLNNSNIYGVNSIIMADLADSAAEGIQWYRDSTHADSMWVKNGVMYFTPNRPYGGTATDYTIMHSNNYTNYTVTKAGSGASGTWGINITGNAGSASKLQTARTISLTGSVTGSGSFDGSGNLTISTTTNHTHSSVTDIGSGSTTTFAYSKAGLDYNAYTWLAAWNGYELRAVNKSQFATAGHTHNYLPLTGGTISGNLSVTGTINGFSLYQNHFWYSQTKTVKPSDANVWYVTLTLKRAWNPYLDRFLIEANYDNISGLVYVYKDSYADKWVVYVTDYNNCHIQGISMTGGSNTIIYLKLDGSKNAICTYRGAYGVTSMTASSTAPSGVTFSGLRNGIVSNTAITCYSTIYGNLSGNASTATKATNDSLNQNIANNYIKNLTINGKTITYTKGNGTTGTLTTQDTNTWRGIVNNLTSDSTTDSLAAAQGKALKGLVDGKVAKDGTGATGTWGINISGTAAMTNKMATYKQGSTTETYGTQYSLYAQWETKTVLKLKVDDYTVKVDYANKAAALDANAGSTTQPIYFSSGKPVVCTYTLSKSVPADAKFTDTNTWRGIQNNLTSTSTTDSLSAAQGKILNDVTLQRRGTIYNTTDWNTITLGGVYKVQMSAWGDASTMHSPNGYNGNLYPFGLLLVLNGESGGENRISQFYIPHNESVGISGMIYKRMHNGSSWESGWQSWHPIARGLSWSDIINKPTTFIPTSHTHTKSQITDFPTSMPASDVYAWAKASTKPSYSWGEITGKPSTFTPSTHSHTVLSLYGGRPANINFSTNTNGAGALFHFVATSSTTTGKPPADCTVLQMNWDNNGGWDTQFAIQNGANAHCYVRSQNNGTWPKSWVTLIDSTNCTSYTSGASNRLNTNDSTASTDPGGLTWNNLDGSTVGAVVNRNDTPTGAWWYILRNRHTNTENNYYTDVAIPFNDSSIYYKIVRNGAVVNKKWCKVLDAWNYSSYALPLSGGTISGDLTVTGITISQGLWGGQKYLSGDNWIGWYATRGDKGSTRYGYIQTDTSASGNMKFVKEQGGYFTFNTEMHVQWGDVIMDHSTAEQRFRFYHASKNNHDIYMYKGASTSTTIIGVYDTTDGLVWSYNTGGFLTFSKPIVIHSANYGSTLPSSGATGQIFFKI